MAEKEYIERGAYYRQIDNLSKGKHGDYCAAINDCMNALDEQPAADVVAVVRCKDCVHYQNGACNHFGYYTYAPDVDEYDFCSYGERKEQK